MQSSAISDFAAWIATTSLSNFFVSHLWLIPASQSVHYMALAILFSSAAIIDLRILGLIGGHQTLARTVQRFVPGIWIALVFMTLTGLLLLIAEPGRSVTAWEFQVKMVMLFCVIVLTLFLQRRVAQQSGGWSDAAGLPGSAKLLAVVSLVLWLLTIVAGRWIAYHA